AWDAANPLDRRMCVKGHTWPQRIYLPERLKYPMRRKEGTERGAGEWEQITWDEAITEVTTKWKHYADTYGPSSVVAVRGDGNLGMANTHIKTLFSLMGCTTVELACDRALTHFAGPKVIGYDPWFFGNDPKTMTMSDTVFVWGANTSTSAQTSWPYIQAAFDAGANFICVDPQYTVLASKSHEWYAIRPGTDAALAMAMINVIVQEGLQDERTIKLLKYDTVGPWLVKPDGTYLRPSDFGQEVPEGQNVALCMGTDGSMGSNFQPTFDPILQGEFDLGGLKVTTAYTLLLRRCAEMTVEKAAEITDIPADKIRYLAHKYVEGKVANMANTGIDHHTNGGQSYMALFDLMMIAGQFAEPGRGQYGGNATNISMGWTSSTWAGASEGGMNIYSPYFPKAYREKKWNGQSFTPKMIYMSGANVLGIFVGAEEWLEVLKDFEYVVHVEVVLSDTAKYADLLLPAAEYFERWDLNYTINPYMSINEKALETPYECKSDFDIDNLLLKALGFGDYAMTIEDFMDTKLDTALCKMAGINSWEDMKKIKNVYTAVDNYFLGASKPYYSPTGMLNLYFENIQPLNDYGQVASGELDQKWLAMAGFEPMEEAWNETVAGYPQSEHSKTYPINVMSWRSRFRTHTMFSTVPALLEMLKDPCVYMNPDDMRDRGIAEGDMVKVYNERGYVIIRAAEHPGVRRKTAMMEH
ncbi:MAG: molybdopterin-dependent oxidoreductase, partial [Eggerthellaceae bacterium]|nr:molybdopterin-dependent oxidoreductase [Eggerthellaceae bacterium]